MADDPEIVSDVLFAVANVLSIARTTYLMPAFEVLGTLQISLVRMLGDITRFLVLFTLVRLIQPVSLSVRLYVCVTGLCHLLYLHLDIFNSVVWSPLYLSAISKQLLLFFLLIIIIIIIIIVQEVHNKY